MQNKVEFKVENVTFYYNKPDEIDILALKVKVNREGFDELEDAAFLQRVIKNYVSVKKGFITKKLTWDYLERYSDEFIEEFLRKLVRILI